MQPLAAHDQRRSTVATLGIVGGGQLAKMTAQAAMSLGCEVVVLERSEIFPANALDTRSILGDWDDPQKLIELAEACDLVTLENEFVDARALGELERKGHRLHPGARTMALVQDKLVQKETFASAGLPLPRFRRVDAPRDVELAARDFGWPLVLKKRRNGYDGKGNATLKSALDVEGAWRKLGGAAGELYVEAFCTFTRELATQIARSASGATAAYPLVESINQDHICRIVKAPADVPLATGLRAEEIARAAIAAVDGVGVFGLELFLMPAGQLLINEIAPRVHNTGHYTIEGCECSQFENHVRAVLGWPLGSTALLAPHAAMVNLLGVGAGAGTPHGLERALAVPGAHVHVYGKTTSQRGRKMGHVTALGTSSEAALQRARAAADVLRFGNNEEQPQ
jgi:5-(carboxyamino)imidazole ribonucleotide synthase